MNFKRIDDTEIEKLYKALTSIETVEDCKAFLADLCTKKEIEQMAQRLAGAQMLIEGKTYNEVIEKTELSSATVSRISNAIRYGEGYSKLLKK